MSSRKRKIIFIQVFLFLVSVLVIFNTYFKKDKVSDETIISFTDKEKIKSNNNDGEREDVFYNIEYSGLDLSGNRYILKSKEARSNKESQEIVKMKMVNAIFYFKDGTTLFIESEKGIYNNKSLDMTFEDNVKASYEESELFGEKIVYLNSKKTLLVSKNVRVNDIRGSILADDLLFDLETKKLDITANNANKIKANVNLKWKKVLEY